MVELPIGGGSTTRLVSAVPEWLINCVQDSQERVAPTHPDGSRCFVNVPVVLSLIWLEDPLLNASHFFHREVGNLW